MKHSLKITLLLLGMFLLTQLIGLFVVAQYAPHTTQIKNETGQLVNITNYNLPYGTNPPAQVEDKNTFNLLFSFAISFAIAIGLMFVLMKFGAEVLIRTWFFVVVSLALGITINSFLFKLPIVNASIIALIVAVPLAYFKIFKRNVFVHNITELFIYPGIAAIFVSLITSWTNYPVFAAVVIFLMISIYDIYAVWHAGFMQKMAHYQIKKLNLFTGFFIPYLGKKEREMIREARAAKLKTGKEKKIKVNVAILGGGDVVFPIILAGVVLFKIGLLGALFVSLGSTIALAYLFYVSEKGKFYPAMPFITIGAFIGLILAYIV